MKTKIMTIGAATTDTIIEYTDPETLNLHSTRGTLSYLLLEEGKKIEITWLGEFSGGGGTNSAVAFKKLGFDVICVAKVGPDNAGNHIIDELNKAGVETNYIQRDKKERTALSYIIPSLKGDRTIFAYRGANANLMANDIPLDAIAYCQQLYITSLSGDSSMQLPLITQVAKQHGVPIAINPGFSQLRLGADFIAQSLKDIDILIVNSHEAKQLMVSLLKLQGGLNKNTISYQSQNKSTMPSLLGNPITHEEVSFRLTDFFRLVLTLGPRLVIATNGDEGVYVADKEQVYFHPILENSKTVNTLGAGDAFGSTFVAFTAQGKTVEQAIYAGIINSSSVVGYRDAKTGLLSEKELHERLQNVPDSKLQKYKL